jgi:hypothetical protein
MSSEAREALHSKIEDAIDYIASEHGISTTEVIGVLEMVKFGYLDDAFGEEDDEDIPEFTPIE